MDRLFDEEFKFLKANTHLGLISLYKLSSFANDMEKLRADYYKVEGDLLDYDIKAVKKFEYELRFSIWKNKCMDQWLINSDGLGRIEFAKRAMEQQMAREKRFNSKKKVRKLK